jgi:biopolymer transport protein ExbB
MMKHFLFLLLALTALAASAETFDPGAWAHKRKVAIDSSATGVELKEGAAQVPLALRLHTGNFPFNEAKPDGSDLRVTAADGKTPLRFQIESFDAANELGVIWVQVPKLAPNTKSDSLWLYWGNEKSTPLAETRGPYEGTQSLVLHFSEKDAPRDATGNGNNPREPAVRLGAIGPLAGAATFDGTGHLTLPASPTLKLTAAGGFTFTAWLKPADVAAATLYEQTEGARGLALRLKDGVLVLALDNKELRADKPLLPGTWQHVAVSVGGGKATFYINGAPAGSGDAALADLGGEASIGANYRGDMDEATGAPAPRSADYVKALYGSQQPDGALLTVAEEAGEEGGGVSYFAILLGAVTVDGWVVIGILIVMFFISVAVMVGKTRFVLRVRKANGAFMEYFKDKSVELLGPDAPEAVALANNSVVKESPIYRLYEIGLREMKHRFDAQAAKGQEIALSAAALDAIRASMDGGMVRETQRLNSQIVLLTIAISGGPFLGLLGTVVGVMITFAAIAAAGDVNVNSIAPGIAAALVATVAGLGVAIPALFGYNWLASQIKEVTADTHVFSDEFLTKAAELYSR